MVEGAVDGLDIENSLVGIAGGRKDRGSGVIAAAIAGVSDGVTSERPSFVVRTRQCCSNVSAAKLRLLQCTVFSQAFILAQARHRGAGTASTASKGEDIDGSKGENERTQFKTGGKPRALGGAALDLAPGARPSTS